MENKEDFTEFSGVLDRFQSKIYGRGNIRHTSSKAVEIAHDTKKKKNRFPSKSEVMATVIRVLPLFGFKGGTVNLVNVLLNFTQKQDWQAKKPVVWACNNTLADLAGFFSESGARKALYRLRAEGLNCL